MSGSPFNSAAWRRRVIATPKTVLSPSQKLVLLMLETFADYRDGTNAHPGIQVLAEMCGLTSNAVGTALGRGRLLGLIERTEPANRGGGKADVYRLILTPTAVGATSPLTPPAVGVSAADYPNGDNAITPTATTRLPQRPLVPPTHDQLNINGGSPQPGTSPGLRDQSTDEPTESADGQPANGKPPSWIRGPFGPRCLRHGHHKAAPADCTRCQDAAIAARESA